MPRHSWTEYDNIIALDAYFSIVDKREVSKNDAIARAVILVNRRSLCCGGRGFDNFNSMKMKIQCFEDFGGKGGLGHVSKLGMQAWGKYHNAPDELKKRMAEIIAELSKKEKESEKK